MRSAVVLALGSPPDQGGLSIERLGTTGLARAVAGVGQLAQARGKFRRILAEKLLTSGDNLLGDGNCVRPLTLAAKLLGLLHQPLGVNELPAF